MNFSILDGLFCLILIIMIIRGMVKGFVEEFLSMAAIYVGIIAAVIFSSPGSVLLVKFFGPSIWHRIIAFLIIFLIVYLLIKLLENAMHNFFDKLNLEKLDQALGSVFGFIQGVVIISLIILILDWLKWVTMLNTTKLVHESFIAQILLPLLNPVAQQIPNIRKP